MNCLITLQTYKYCKALYVQQESDLKQLFDADQALRRVLHSVFGSSLKKRKRKWKRLKGNPKIIYKYIKYILAWQGLLFFLLIKKIIKNNDPVLMDKEERDKECENMYLSAGK